MTGSDVTLTKYAHSCLLIETGAARILLDPGVFSRGFEELDDLAAVLITHSHPDHLDVARIAAVRARNPEATVYADEVSAAQLTDAGVPAEVVRPGDAIDIAGLPVAVYGGEHAQIAPGFPVPPNVGFAIDGRFAYSGDAYASPPEPVQVLAMPVAAPWLLAADAVGYLQRMKPQATVPVHDELLSIKDPFYNLYRRYAEEQGTAFRVIDDGAPVTF